MSLCTDILFKKAASETHKLIQHTSLCFCCSRKVFFKNFFTIAQVLRKNKETDSVPFTGRVLLLKSLLH